MQQHKNKEEHLWRLTEGYKKAYTPDVEKGLQALKSKMAQSASPTPVIALRTWLTRAASIAVLVIGGLFLYQQMAIDSPSALQVIQSDDTAISLHQLPDGTELWLNKNSKLTHPIQFTDGERKIQLEGEAFLKVVKNPSKPFIIEAGGSTIEVLGTAFSVKAYPKEASTIVSVEEGKVAFEAISAGKKLILQANEKGTYQKEAQQLTKSTTHAIADLGWKEQKLVFKDTPLSEILDYLDSQFGVTVLATEQLKSCDIIATFVDNQPDAILNRITDAFPIQLTQLEDKKYQLSGSCK